MPNLQHYIDTIINPTITDFAKEPRSVRLAFLSCVAVFHAVDYIAYPKNPGNLRRKLREESAHFKIVDAIAHAIKHVETDGQPEKRLHSEQVISRPPLFYDIGFLGLSRYNDATGGVTLNNNRMLDILDVVKHARDFIQNKYGQSDQTK